MAAARTPGLPEVLLPYTTRADPGCIVFLSSAWRASHSFPGSIGTRKSDWPPACVATGTPSRYSTRLLVSAGTRAPGVMMPVRFSGSAADSDTRSPLRFLLADRAHRGHGIGQRVLLAAHAGDEAAAADLSLRLEPAEHAQQRMPGRQPVGLALEQLAEHHAVAAQQDLRHLLERLGIVRRAS